MLHYILHYLWVLINVCLNKYFMKQDSQMNIFKQQIDIV